ncbi:MAG: sugar-binding protein [Pirellulaceae bacterium]
MRSTFAGFAVLIAAMLAGCDSGDGKNNATDDGAAKSSTANSSEAGEKRHKIAFVTNCVADFWKIGEAGAMKAAQDLNVDVEVKMPPATGGTAPNQKRILEQLMNKGVEAFAVSPADPANQTDLLNEIAKNSKLITHDSDAPDSNRLLYVGMSNYDAGRMVGELVKEAIPDGGNVILFIGSIEQDNGRLRRQGVIDELLDRSHDPKRYDAPDEEVGNDKYTILATRVDDFDEARKKQQPEQALVKYDKIDCMVGLFEYNPPFILDALTTNGKIGQIKVVGFDENPRTLEEIKKGNCVGTVVQDPFNYGYKSVEILTKMLNGDDEFSGKEFVDIPARKITKENVEEFQKNLQELLGSN